MFKSGLFFEPQGKRAGRNPTTQSQGYPVGGGVPRKRGHFFSRHFHSWTTFPSRKSSNKEITAEKIVTVLRRWKIRSDRTSGQLPEELFRRKKTIHLTKSGNSQYMRGGIRLGFSTSLLLIPTRAMARTKKWTEFNFGVIFDCPQN